MRDLVLTTKYKKDLKGLSKNPLFSKYSVILVDYLARLQRGEPLPEKAHNHTLSKSSPKIYQGCWDFHVVPDICVIYRKTKDTIELIRIGQHNNLGLTENFSD